MQQDFRWHKTLLVDTKRQCYLAPEIDQLLLPQEEKILCEFLSLQKINRLNVNDWVYISVISLYKKERNVQRLTTLTTEIQQQQQTRLRGFCIYGEGTIYYKSPQRMAIEENTAYNTYTFILPAMQNLCVQKKNHLFGGNYKRKIK